MFEKDIDAMKQKLYYAIEQGDKDTIYDISVRLDVLIVEFYNYYKN
ncbi:aspartyl-phosphate phosphatase Spo0E family protein [Oxobacter pfennigii]|nr:aspartyl-phosphate phosphatase Spo0E family protein [Oxobacter pfennigii]